MGIARHGDGLGAAVRALASQVHPVFMLPPLAASWFGAILAGWFDPGLGAVHATAIFAAVYTAHIKDGYVDFYERGEDDDHPLTPLGCRLALVGATVLFVCCLLVLWLTVDPVAALVTAPCWVIAYHHAPQLDTNPVTATMGYPVGIALAIVGGYYVQTSAFDPLPLAFALVFVLVLSGVKVVDDAQDFAYDRSIDKRTVAVVLGPLRARKAAYGSMAGGLCLVLVLVATGVFPPGSVGAVVAFGVVAALTRRAGPERATMLLVRGSYLFLAVLVVAVWYEPLY